MRVDEDLSPAVMRKAVRLGTRLSSFKAATESVKETLEIDLEEKRLTRLVKRIGAERVDERDEATKAWDELPLVEKLDKPKGVAAPTVVAAMVDGGRMQRCDPPEGAKTHWVETKVGVLLEFKPNPHASDPCPEVPDKFLDLAQMDQLTREIHRSQAAQKGTKFESAEQAAKKADENATAEPPPPDVVAEARAAVVCEPPELLAREVVATQAHSSEFGRTLAAAAHSHGFTQATLKAFVADGLPANWTIWSSQFKHHGFVPILDFIHALTYVFAAAMAGRTRAEGGPVYIRWITLVWRGEVQTVIAELAARGAELGPLPPAAPETDPRAVVAESLTYLTNQQSRMNYAEYRKLGMPITSSHIESTVKQIGQRVKGSEKFWSRPGGEDLLQLRADIHCDSAPLEAFWIRRAKECTGTRTRHSPKPSQPSQTSA